MAQTNYKLPQVTVEFGPLKNVLLTYNVCVDKQVAISNTEVLLTGGTFETLKVVHFVTNSHCHFKCPDPLLTGSTQPILTKQSAKERGYLTSMYLTQLCVFLCTFVEVICIGLYQSFNKFVCKYLHNTLPN